MKCIYRMYNTDNGKSYIGQTNNFRLRMNGHKSDAFNKNASSYNYPLSNAIRKHGWEKFKNTIIETIPDGASQDYVDEREIYYIEHFHSITTEYGYNILRGGQQGQTREKLNYEQRLSLSNIFSAEEIKDIQFLLKKGTPMKEIREKYQPRLSTSLLQNINIGLNFKNDNWEYPLHNYHADISSRKYTHEEMKEIKQDIKSGMKYVDIAQKWDTTIGFISSINNGRVWKDSKETYPLIIKSCSRLHNYREWVKPVQQDLMNSNLTMQQIAEKYNKAYSTIKKINYGSSYREKQYLYPLTKNRMKKQGK